MKRTVWMAGIAAGSFLALVFSLYYVFSIYRNDLGMSHAPASGWKEQTERVVLISREQGSYMLEEIQKGARASAAEHRMRIDVRGVYRSNLEELLKQLNIAIASKVDGIIVEGVDQPEFVRTVNKATSRGIPVITINSDAPGSLRKTYVGADHYQEGVVMGSHIADRLNGKGLVGVIRSTSASDADRSRLKGLEERLSQVAGLQLVYATEENAAALPQVQTFDILNHFPNVSAFAILPADAGESIVQAVYSRSRVNEYQLFEFDDSPRTRSFIERGVIQAGLSQHYEDMGRMSVDLMKQWLTGTLIPLDNSYYTPIGIVTPPGTEGGRP